MISSDSIILLYALFSEFGFIVCYWSHCGGGKCNKTSNLTYNCLCQEGYDNLLNNTAFPCFKDCKNTFLFFSAEIIFYFYLIYVLCFQPIILTSCKFTPNLWFVKKQKLSPTKCPWCIMDFHLIFVHYVNKDSKKWHITLHVKLNIITCHFLLDLLIK